VRRLLLRSIAIFLMVYSVIGLILSAAVWSRVSALTSSLSEMAQGAGPEQTAATLRVVASTLRSASATSGSATVSLTRAEESLTEGSASTSDLGRAISVLSESMKIDFLGTRPFGNVADPLTRSAASLGNLSNALIDTRTALELNRRDLSSLQGDLDSLQRSADILATRAESYTSTAELSRTIGNVDLLAKVIIGAFAVQSFLFLGLGVAMLLTASAPHFDRR
jgi:hypothetical protein